MGRKVCKHKPCRNPPRSAKANYCSDHCAWRASARRHRVKRRVTALIRRKALLGRVCRWCRRSDAEGQFYTPTECSSCSRQRYGRSSCGRCGGPFYYTTFNRFGAVGCPKCNEMTVGERLSYDSRRA